MATTNTAVRKGRRHRKASAAAFVPSRPSDDYLALAQIPSTRLSTPCDGEPLPRKLLVLDLNGTLVLRAPRTWGSHRPVMNRPFAKTFCDYVFHQGSQLDVMVWSSAQPHSVDSMVDSFFGSQRSRLVGLWARDTLGLTEEQYAQKVQTIKDLNIIWDAPAGLPPPIKIAPPPPMAVLTNDPTTVPGYDPSKPPAPVKTRMHNSAQLMESLNKPDDSDEEDQDRTTYWAVPEVRPEDPIPGLAGDGGAPGVAKESPGLYSALNTLLLDDSPLKAHLQPYNNLTLPEYTADLRARDLKRRDALEELAIDPNGPTGENAEGDKMDEAAHGKVALDPMEAKAHYYKTMRAPPFDKTLIAVIGVLDAVRHESSIVGWMHAGGMHPDPEEMTRVAGLFKEEQNHQEPLEEGVGDLVEDDEERSPLKRSSNDMGEGGQGGPKRRRSNLEPPLGTTKDPTRTDAAGEMQIDTLPNALVDKPIALHNAKQTRHIRESSSLVPETAVSAPSASATLPEPPTAFETSGTSSTRTPSSRARNKRRRYKPFYPPTHPLSAEDSYPFFIGGEPEKKLWFQDREWYTYWVRRGLLALRECGIEPEPGVEGR